MLCDPDISDNILSVELSLSIVYRWDVLGAYVHCPDTDIRTICVIVGTLSTWWYRVSGRTSASILQVAVFGIYMLVLCRVTSDTSAAAVVLWSGSWVYDSFVIRVMSMIVLLSGSWVLFLSFPELWYTPRVPSPHVFTPLHHQNLAPESASNKQVIFRILLPTDVHRAAAADPCTTSALWAVHRHCNSLRRASQQQ